MASSAGGSTAAAAQAGAAMKAPPGFVASTGPAVSAPHAAALLAWLESPPEASGVPWERAIEGRRVAQWGCRYDYGTQSVDTTTPVAPIPACLRGWLPGVDASYTQCIVNSYGPDDAIPYHADDYAFGPSILVFCFGEARPLLLRQEVRSETAEAEGGAYRHFRAVIGDRGSYEMSGETRYDWQHAIPTGEGKVSAWHAELLLCACARVCVCVVFDLGYAWAGRYARPHRPSSHPTTVAPTPPPPAHLRHLPEHGRRTAPSDTAALLARAAPALPDAGRPSAARDGGHVRRAGSTGDLCHGHHGRPPRRK